MKQEFLQGFKISNICSPVSYPEKRTTKQITHRVLCGYFEYHISLKC